MTYDYRPKDKFPSFVHFLSSKIHAMQRPPASKDSLHYGEAT